MELILNTYGTSLIKDSDTFLVVHKDGKQRVHPSVIKSIIISRGAQITSDAALLAIDNEIEVLFVDKTGNPKGRIWSHKYGSVSTIRKGQVDFAFSKDALQWIKSIIMQKMENQQALLLSLHTTSEIISEKVNSTIKKIEDYREKINNLNGEIIPDIAPGLRGWEGAASKIYFETVNLFLSDIYKMTGRHKHPALDLCNCLLNYAYGILYGKIEGSLIRAGVDPYVGIFHRDDYNRPVLVFDIIERYRVWADYVVFALAIQEVINEDCFSIRDDGSFWLEGLGKRILIQSMNDYLQEVINEQGVNRSRLFHIDLYSQSIAQKFKKYA